MGNEIKKDDHFVECGCCGNYHRDNFFGDCRDNEERFNLSEIEDAGEEYQTLDEMEE